MQNLNICPICGSVLELEGKRLKCRYCGYSKAEEAGSEESSLLYVAFQKLRMADFDEAGELFSDILRRFPNSAEAYWGATLAEYGIKYEDDYDGKKIPTCYAAKYESFEESSTYKKAIACASKEQKDYYQSQSKKIDAVREEWVEKAEKEPPYDVFLSFKDTDKGERTSDSEEAYEIYNILTGLGYRVFFSRVTLSGKTGENYEPYIFAALNSAPVMLIYASRKEYIESTWVRNEWNRYLARIRAKQKLEGSICVIFKDPLDPGKLPAALRRVQNLKRNEITFLDSLRNYVGKYVNASRIKTPRISRKEVALAKKQGQKSIEAVKMEEMSSISVKSHARNAIDVEKRQVGAGAIAALSSSEESELSQAEIYLSHGDTDRAISLYEDVLSSNPHNQQALLGALLIRTGCKSLEELSENPQAIAANLDLAASAVDYSESDVANAVLQALAKACLDRIEHDDFILGKAIYEKVSHYDVPIVNELHESVFSAASEKAKLDEAIALCRLCLPFLSSDAKAYRSALERVIDSSFKAKRYEDCIEFAEQYGQYFDYSAKIYEILLASRQGQPDLKAWLYSIAEKGDFSSLSGGLPLSEEEIANLFEWAAEMAVEMIPSSPLPSNALVRFLLPYRFPKREAFIKKGIKACQDHPNQKTAKVLDGFLHAYGDDRFDEFINAQEGFVKSCFEKGEYALAAHYLDRLIEYDPEKYERYLSRCCARIGCDENGLKEKIHLLSGFSDVEAMIANRGERKVSASLAPLLEAAEDAANPKEACPVFDTLIGYLPKEEDDALLAHLGMMARSCLNASLFDEAERYFSSIVTLDAKDHSAYFGILLAKLHAKNEEELIRQQTPIGGFVEFDNAKLAAGKDRKALEHYIEIELKQTQWAEQKKAKIAKEEEDAKIAAELEAKRLEEEKKRKAKRKKTRIIVISSVSAVAFFFAAAIAIIVPLSISLLANARIDSAITAIYQRDYDSAIKWLEDQTYGESKNVLNMAKAGKYFQRKDDVKGIDYVLAAGGSVHAYFAAEHATLGASEATMNPSTGQMRSTCDPDSGYVFQGWELTNYTVTLSNASYSSSVWLQAKVLTNAEAKAQEAWDRAHGVVPVMSGDGKYVTYGMYPQSRLSNASLISKLNALGSSNAENGWHQLDDEYYYKLASSWYSVEPIKWRVLDSSGGELLIVSDLILDAHRFDEGSNNYKESEIRTWLNGTFLLTAFPFGGGRILLTEVDNSAASTNDASNRFACENTLDEAFLLSNQEYRNESYGFSSATRQCEKTDYASANGLYGFGVYWTRSPSSSDSMRCWMVGADGLFSVIGGYVIDSIGVRPGLRITIA